MKQLTFHKYLKTDNIATLYYLQCTQITLTIKILTSKQYLKLCNCTLLYTETI